MIIKGFLSIILLFAVSIANGQTYSKDLAKAAKRGDVVAQRDLGLCYINGLGTNVNDKKAFEWLSLAAEGGDAEAMYLLGKMYEDGKVKNGNAEMAWSWYVKAANVGNIESQMILANSLKEQDKLAEAKDWFFKAAIQGNADAQYEYAMILLSENNESEAKSWFKKAADKNHILSKIKYDAIVQHEREVAEAEARRLALETARRDSIQRMQAEQQRRQDSLDYATGKRIPPYSWLVRDCSVSSLNDFFKFSSDPVVQTFISHCKNGSGKDEKFAFVLDWKSLPVLEGGFKFENDFHENLLHKSVAYNYMYIRSILIPLKSGCTIYEQYSTYHYFRCNEASILEDIKQNRKNIKLLAIIKPGFHVPTGGDGFMDHYCSIPVGLYLFNQVTGVVILDLSSYLRKINVTTEKQSLLRANKLRIADIERSKPTQHSTPKRERCVFCNGLGYVEYFPVGSATLTRQRCSQCYGRGYLDLYYY